ncbi:MAG: hypothetical protein A2086_01140 [Spirochaetes bacterium GWD1_27_9]|nr:MAG: hypothetical protein A2Z98_16070 [Spirochaetes bacterium GWB1_27_13]OHD27977.1 MAG: hypothetical protein A2Y34_11460 [Spirochaetes bacterium GWC1_27_15]OHD33657.1 MAG: hypothetical protein A2086_01140 [Spirochaetes bacterium GWD1_27_9]
MEVLKSDDKLREEILNDAKTKAERVTKKIKGEVDLIEKDCSSQIEKIDNNFRLLIEKEISLETKKIFAGIDIEVKKKTLDFVGKIVDEIFENIKKSIENNQLINYKDFIFKLINNSVSEIQSTSYILEISKKELEKLGKKDLESLKLKNAKIEQIIEKNIDGIALYSSDRKKLSFISLSNFIERLKSEERIKIYEILTKNEE